MSPQSKCPAPLATATPAFLPLRAPTVRSVRFPGALLLLLPFLLTACAEEKSTAKPPRPVRVQTVAAAQAPPPLRFSGTIEPIRRVSLAFEIAGSVAELARVPGPDGQPRTLEAGDRVAAGAILARLDTLPAEQRRRQAEAQLAEARAYAAKAAADLARAEALFAERAATLPELEAARAAAETSRQRVLGAEAQETLARRGEGDTRLKAPFAATVLRRGAEIGALAAPGVPVFELADTHRLKVVFGVPDTVVGRLAPGQQLPIYAPALSGSGIKGEVTTVSPSADPQSRVFAVEVAIPNADQDLKIGMIVSVEVPLEAAAGVEAAEAGSAAARAAVPLSAVVRAQESEGYAVFVLEGEGYPLRARERAVKIGEIFGSEVTLESGLSFGEKVVVAGATLLADGDAVVVIP